MVDHNLKEAQTKNNPPKGLTPTLRLTAMGQTRALTSEVDKLLKECGLKISTTLSHHYQTLIDTNKQEGKSKSESMEAEVNKHPNSTTKKESTIVSREPQPTGKQKSY